MEQFSFGRLVDLKKFFSSAIFEVRAKTNGKYGILRDNWSYLKLKKFSKLGILTDCN